MIDSTRATVGQILVVDAGDATGLATSAVETKKAAFILSVMGRMGYDAMVPGERELGFGAKFLTDEARKSKVPLLAANVVYARNPSKHVTKDYIVVRKNGVRVGLLGLLGSDVLLTPPPGDPDSLKVTDPIETAKRIVPELRKKADVVVLLAHTSYFPAQKIAQDVPGIDVVVVGHAPGQGDVPPSTAGPIYARSGQRGQSIARTTVELEQGRVTNLASAAVTLGTAIRVDEPMLGVVKKFEDAQNAEALKQQEHAAAQKPTPDGAQQASLGGDKYLGAQTCQRCHSDIYEQWTQTKHGHAMKTLTDIQKDADASCVKCHVVGFGEATGFVSLAATGHLKDVQCEQCHGMATKHAEYQQVGEATCLKCHIPERDPGWNFEKRWEQIKH